MAVQRHDVMAGCGVADERRRLGAMTLPEPSARSESPTSPDATPTTAVAPELPLAILEAVRTHDRPLEVLEEEDLSASLPRRLGLTGVVETQIQRYRDAVRRKRGVALDEVGHLLRLVLRRPDAGAILREAGYEVAHRLLRRRAVRLLGHLPVPRRIARAIARRVARRLLERIAGPGIVTLDGPPLTARITGAVTATGGEYGTACVLYAATIEEVEYLVTGHRPEIQETRCAARGAEACEWKLIQ